MHPRSARDLRIASIRPEMNASRSLGSTSNHPPTITILRSSSSSSTGSTFLRSPDPAQLRAGTPEVQLLLAFVGGDGARAGGEVVEDARDRNLRHGRFRILVRPIEARLQDTPREVGLV